MLGVAIGQSATTGITRTSDDRACMRTAWSTFTSCDISEGCPVVAASRLIVISVQGWLDNSDVLLLRHRRFAAELAVSVLVMLLLLRARGGRC